MPRRITELDGLRGLAALLVVFAHYFGEAGHGVEHLQFGWLGVETFFVLSGFLIGGVIFDEQAKPAFLKSFYIRRSTRILPVYWITLAVTLSAMALFAGAPWVGRTFAMPVYLSFTQNVASALTGHYDATWLRPLWTLAVEEQFYLVLPLVLSLVTGKRVPYALGAIWLAALIFRVATHGNGGLLIQLPARMDLLISGVMAAWAKRNMNLERYMLVLRIAPIPLVTIGTLLYAFAGVTTFAIYHQGFLAVGIAAFILALSEGAPEGRKFLGSAPLRFFGKISYALYLFHQPISGLLHGVILGAEPDIGSPEGMAVSILAVAVSIGAAYTSWVFVEGPLLNQTRVWLSKPALKLEVAK